VRAPAAEVVPASKLKRADKDELASHLRRCREMRNEWIRRQVIDNDRIDILANVVLGLDLQPYHLAMMRWQFVHSTSLQLCFRGAGKSTTCTIAKAIHLLLKDPDLRILIASKTAQNAEGFLKEIKNHFESNELLAEVFGKYYDPVKVTKWDNREIEVLPRTKPNKEASITCVGVEGTIVSKHYDVILSDDLVDEDNSRTKHQRDKTKTWYYQTLDPTLEPPCPEVPHRGEHHHLGTRYHWDDLWGHFIANELKNDHLIIPALDEHGRSPWPERFPPEWFRQKRLKAGLIIFNAQYQCDTECMKGEIFSYDYCNKIDDSKFPETSELRVFMGVDLAISERDKADKFAIVVLGIARDRSAIYVLDFFEGQIRFSAQTRKIIEFAERWDPERIGIETTAYQEAQYQNLKDIEIKEGIELRLRPIKPSKDKITRAWKLSSVFEEGKVFFRKSQDTLISHLVLFPNARLRDLFDAFELAHAVSKKRRKRRSRAEPGVI
jgi:predicted phage terminase large subunit-like protein